MPAPISMADRRSSLVMVPFSHLVFEALRHRQVATEQAIDALDDDWRPWSRRRLRRLRADLRLMQLILDDATARLDSRLDDPPLTPT